MTYVLEFYSTDGEHVREGEFESLAEAHKRWENIGSRWFFYPIGAVFNGRGTLVSFPEYPEFPILKATRKGFMQAIKDNADFIEAVL